MGFRERYLLQEDNISSLTKDAIATNSGSTNNTTSTQTSTQTSTNQNNNTNVPPEQQTSSETQQEAPTADTIALLRQSSHDSTNDVMQNLNFAHKLAHDMSNSI